MRRKKRFKKRPAIQQQDDRYTPHDVTLKSYGDVYVTSYSDITVSAVGSGDAPVVMPCSIFEENLSQEYVVMPTASNADCILYRGGLEKDLFPSGTTSTLCLVCAGCTCYYWSIMECDMLGWNSWSSKVRKKTIYFYDMLIPRLWTHETLLIGQSIALNRVTLSSANSR